MGIVQFLEWYARHFEFWQWCALWLVGCAIAGLIYDRMKGKA